MPPIETTSRHQKAVVWDAADDGEASDFDNYGVRRRNDPREITVRWEETNSELIGSDGNPIAVVGEVFVDEAIAVGSILWKGALADLPTSDYVDLRVVKGIEEIPDIKGRETARVLLVARHSDELPSEEA